MCARVTIEGIGVASLGQELGFSPQLWIFLLLVTQNAVCRSLQDRGLPWPIHTSAKSFYTAARLWIWKGDLEVAVTCCTADHHDGNGEYILCGLYCGYMSVSYALLVTQHYKYARNFSARI